MDPSHSIFAVLTLIVAPAVLTNASSVLGLNTANRFGRAVDRSRMLTAELSNLPRDSALFKLRSVQLERLYDRAHLLLRAQASICLALGLFVATALVAVLGGALARTHPIGGFVLAVLGLLVGMTATGSLLYGCILIVRETRIALKGMREEIAYFEEAMPVDVAGAENLSPL